VWSKRLHGVDPATGAECQGVGEMGGSVITGRGLHSFPFQLNLSSSVHRITQINS
jgi:hypothetical protein